MNANHYIRTNDKGLIIAGFSEVFQQPESTDILICTQGSYQFRLFPGGEENPSLLDSFGVPLYRWEGKVIKRTLDETEADRPPKLGIDHLGHQGSLDGLR